MTWDRRSVLGGLAAGAVLLARPVFADPPPGRSLDDEQSFPLKIAAGAELRARTAEVYDPSYVRLAYPMGDVADDRGVCADTVVRAFRHAGVDLQQAVHEDMAAHFSAYPQIWGLSRPDSNIDHRRVPNLETLFRRRGGARTASRRAEDYRAGDIVSWRLAGSGLPHIGVVTRVLEQGEPMVAHNIGAGTRIERVLFAWPIAGWFRFERWA